MLPPVYLSVQKLNALGLGANPYGPSYDYNNPMTITYLVYQFNKELQGAYLATDALCDY
jgi:hypothetical protein